MTLIISFPIPIIIALMLNQVKSKKYASFVQTVLYAPNFITVVVLVGMMSVLLSPSTGIVNLIIQKLGGNPVHFMGEHGWFRWLYVLSGVWQTTGFNAIIYLGALAGVPTELYEAAKIDGASAFQRFREITMPMVFLVAAPTFITQYTQNFNNFSMIYLFNNGGPGSVGGGAGATDILISWIYKLTTGTSPQYSMAAAITLIISALVIVVSLTVFKRTNAFNMEDA
jgi:arabinogalactan oligomer/maltooligosaccharide transport system permease protein